MSSKKKIFEKDKINLIELTRIIWNERILILSITLIFLFLGYFYGINKIQSISKTSIKIRNVSNLLLTSIDNSFDLQNEIEEEKTTKSSFFFDFNQNFILNLASLDNLINFYEKNTKIDNIKSKLSEENTNMYSFFKKKLQYVQDRNKTFSTFTFTYPSTFPGLQFLNDYVAFTKLETERMYKNQITQILKLKLNNYKFNLQLQSQFKDEKTEELINGYENNSLSDMNYKITQSQINRLEYFLNKVKDLSVDYDPILEKASSSYIVSKSPFIMALQSSLLGLIISFVTLIIKRISRSKIN